ncbi:cobalt-precorrin-4 methyltransferase [Vibrio salinus]|uniref:cobalt-precorrin-4 methyltransferase n=1 Tax=Vibrio salinus TaxID=2899784 RepID=UPI001E4B7B09|nr:cobalt-precorrin-4 methyltransferase [Vibrio salinus]MCE0495668.1 cobalt-precorrin-4 methyltransferase [Vibrio salinus]
MPRDNLTPAEFDTSLVYFVGAGPGDPELLTIKGYKLLSQADVVIYAGSLVNPKLLEYCKSGANCVDSAGLHLEEILTLMVDGVRSNKLVVRLQTGDLSLYGSIREQGEELAKHGIGFRSVAGVSSFLGAASELGVEYTVPEVSQSLIITRMAGRTPTPELENLASFARHQTSMAIFLSVQGIENVVEQLLDGGYPKDTPAAVVYKATWPDCEKLTGTLETIAGQVEKAGIRKTALILVGRFLGEEYFYSKLYDAEFSHEYR